MTNENQKSKPEPEKAELPYADLLAPIYGGDEVIRIICIEKKKQLFSFVQGLVIGAMIAAFWVDLFFS